MMSQKRLNSQRLTRGKTRGAALALFLAGGLAGAGPARAEPPFQLADLETTPTLQSFASSSDSMQLEHGRLLFVGRTPTEGYELWLSTGTQGGTVLLKDILPGPQSSTPREFVEFEGKVYFFATSLEHGRELWRSDGTAAGTVLVEDVLPGNEGQPYEELAATDDHLFFNCKTATQGTELCVFDGSGVVVLDLVVGSGSSSPSRLERIDAQTVCFSATTSATGYEPWCSDGTVVGTDLLADVYAGSSSSFPYGFVPAGAGEVLFAARPAELVTQLVHAEIDGGELTVFDLNGGYSSSPTGFRATLSGVFFAARATGHGTEPWWFDNATELPAMLEIEPGSPSGAYNGMPSVATGDRVFFIPSSGELWVTDGTPGTTSTAFSFDVRLEDVADILVDGGFLYFRGSEPGSNDALWQLKSHVETPSDKPARRVFDFGGDTNPKPRAVFDDHVLFTASPPGSSPSSLFIQSLPGRGANQISPNVTTSGSDPELFTPIPGGVAFSASTPAGSEPWRSVLGVGTQMLEDLNPGGEGSYPNEFGALDAQTILFFTSTSAVPDEPYLWDGAAVTRVDLVAVGDSYPSGEIVVFADKFLVAADDSGGDRVAWIIETDPLAVTQLPAPGIGRRRLALGSQALFQFENELWATDGTSGGTVLLATLPYSSDLTALVATEPLVGAATALFIPGGGEVWVSDGTPAGTGLSANFLVDVDGFTISGERGLAILEPPASRYELGVTDGTPPGTFQVTDRSSADLRVDDSDLRILGSVPGGWIFADGRIDSGVEPWFTDGLNPPVELELWPGPSSSDPRAAGRVGDIFYFYATTADRGNELWQTDGTLAGTLPAMELHPGPASEWVSGSVFSGGVLYFSASGPGGDGDEPWAWAPVLFEDGFESGDLTGWSASVF